MANDVGQLLTFTRRKLAGARVSREVAWRLVAVGLLTLVAVVVERRAAWPVASWVGVIAVAGAALDMLWRVRLPTMLDAAIEVDRQWGLHELLSSALLAKNTGAGDEVVDGAFAAAVEARAAEAAGRVKVAQLDGGDYGARQWIAALIVAGVVPLLHASVTRSPSGYQLAAVPEAAQSADGGSRSQRATEATATDRAGEAGSSAKAQQAVSEERSEMGTTLNSARQSQGEMAGKSAGGGLATGGATAAQAAPEATGAGVPQAGRGEAVPGSGAGPADRGRAGVVDAGGTVAGTTPAQPAGIGGSRSLTPRAQLWQQQIPPEYHDVLKAYFER